jgi:hypothetical protein
MLIYERRLGMKLKSVNIKGKEYIEVNERIRAFRELYKDYSLETDIVELNAEYCVLKAIIKNEEGRIMSIGLAREVNGDTFINKTSYVENAETSAWGRALGNFGIGISTSIASAEEVTNAVNNQEKKPDNYDNPDDSDTINLIKGELDRCNSLGEFEKVKERLEAKTYLYFEKKNQVNNLKRVQELVEQTAERLK